MKVLTFAASNSKKSINKQLAIYASSLIEDAEVEVLDINDYEMPIYSQDREEELGIPERAKLFYSKIAHVDAVVVAFAEHNGSYTAAYKNLFDWTSRIDMKVYQNKPMILLATSPGPGGASSVLGTAINSAPFFGANVKGSLSVPSFFDHFDLVENKMTDSDLLSELKKTMDKL